MKKTFIQFCFLLLLTNVGMAQYQFSGYVDAENSKGSIYLSVIEDYRKISGVYPEQILSKTVADSSGYFIFNGNNLPTENRIYRIHVDTCSEDDPNSSHFTGHCINSKEIVFVANNRTILSLPYSFENEIFCRLISPNEKANTFLKIDSLKNDMRYAFGSYRSEANRKLNSKKWFGIFQQYGEQLQEPLAELYSYAFFSNRTNSLRSYYLDDLRSNSYYDDLLGRLNAAYPNTNYVHQYEAELEADKYLISDHNESELPWWVYLVSGVALLAVLGNLYFFRKAKTLEAQMQSKMSLSKQEQKVLDLILQDKSNKEIAADLFVSNSTVKTHINNLYKKLQVNSRDEVKMMYS